MTSVRPIQSKEVLTFGNGVDLMQTKVHKMTGPVPSDEVWST